MKISKRSIDKINSENPKHPDFNAKPIQFDVEGVQCNERGGLCFNLTCALNGKCCDFVSRNEYFRLKNEEYQKAYSDLLKENQELKESIEFWKKAYNGEEAQSAQLREGLVKSIKENQELKAERDYWFYQAKNNTVNNELLEALEGVLFVTSRPNQDCQRIEDARQIAIQAINKAKS